MSMKIGPFEILSELSKSPTTVVYKATDPESGQTIALKAIQLKAFGEQGVALEQALLAEAESTKVLSSSNITTVLGAGEIEGQFCASMEYVQGNSIATMLARKEGFSIWDLLDIGRQLCSGLDHAAKHSLVHFSLEPSKIMCGWDGTVKMLSFGASSAGNFVQYANGGMSSILSYMSPEQVRGEAMDLRSNLYSLGAILYEMVTERKAFDASCAEELREAIVSNVPAEPLRINPKVNPLLNILIMRAMAKDPAERYQSGRELLDDLEKCKESKPLAAKAAAAAKTAAPGKPVNAPMQTASPSSPTPVSRAAAAVAGAASKTGGLAPSEQMSAAAAEPKFETLEPGFAEPGFAEPQSFNPKPAQPKSFETRTAEPRPSSDEAFEAKKSETPVFKPKAREPKPAEPAPRFAVDPMMADGAGTAAASASFSDITELPPLKEVYIAPPSPPPVPQEEAQSVPQVPTMAEIRAAKRQQEEKPRIQPKEIADKAIQEIKGVPPKLMLYAVLGAIALIAVIGIGVLVYLHSQSNEDDAGAPKSSPTSEGNRPTPSQPAPTAQAQPVSSTAAADRSDGSEVAAPARTATAKSRVSRKHAPDPAPVVIPGQLAVDSTPAGAQVQIDGKSDPSWVTPFALTNLTPGPHTITTSKTGYSSDSRSIEVTAGNRTTASIRLAQLVATLVVRSDPPGASIFVDGHDMNTKTPGQVSVDKGQHTVLVRMSGYLDETMSTQFVLGQTFNFAPSLRALGNVDSIKTVGRVSKFFGGKGAQPGQATVSIRTQPKGAQISVNQHMLDKGSPVDVALDPGNYVLDITLSGYAPVHRVITAEKGSKLAVDEVLQRQ